MPHSSRSRPKPAPSPERSPSERLSFEAIGTRWTIDLYDPTPRHELDEIRDRILGRIEIFDQGYSRFRSDSLVSQMARTAGEYTLPPDAAPMLELYDRLYRLTGGALTPLVGSLLSEAGYDADYSLQPGRLHAVPAWEEVMEWRPPTLSLHRPALLDFGALGKGHLVDLVGHLLAGSGIADYTIDAGGDILHRRPGRPLRAGLEHPEHPDQAIGVATLSSGSLCGSSGNRRRWGEFHHIIDPRSLASPEHLRAVWVTAETTLLADGLATALYFASPEALSAHFNYDYALVHTDSSLTRSRGFPAEFFTAASA